MMNLDELIAALSSLRAQMPGATRVYMEHEHPYASEMARNSIESVRVDGDGERYGIYLEPLA